MTSMFTHLDRALAKYVIRTEDALGPIVTAPCSPATPAFGATCDAVPEARGCGHCGSLLDAPCVTCSGKVTSCHKGRAA